MDNWLTNFIGNAWAVKAVKCSKKPSESFTFLPWWGDAVAMSCMVSLMFEIVLFVWIIMNVRCPVTILHYTWRLILYQFKFTQIQMNHVHMYSFINYVKKYFRYINALVHFKIEIINIDVSQGWALHMCLS